MAKPRTLYACAACGGQFSAWSGQCPACREWNSLGVVATRAVATTAGRVNQPKGIQSIEEKVARRLLTGHAGFDEFFGGGLVGGGVTLFGGEPGVGKSTFILQLADHWARNQGPVLYATGEESAGQVRLRAERLGALHEKIDLLATQEVEDVEAALAGGSYGLVIADSIQTLKSGAIDAPLGSVLQLKASLNHLIQAARARNIPAFVIGHITKSGDIAGPKLIEHLVDTVIYLEQEESEILRILRAFKNRFGTVEETLILRMTEKGLVEVKNPGAVYLSKETRVLPGMAVGAFLKGIRPIFCELQALVKKSFLPAPRRLAQGQECTRLQILTAVAEKHAGLNFYEMDIFTSIVGGVKVNDTGLDLPLLAAIVSALLDRAIPARTFFCGEVGLVGEIRKCRLLERRVHEARALGFERIVGPFTSRENGLVPLRQVKDLVEWIRGAGSKSS